LENLNLLARVDVLYAIMIENINISIESISPRAQSVWTRLGKENKASYGATYNPQRLKSGTLLLFLKQWLHNLCKSLFEHAKKIFRIAKERLTNFSDNIEEIKDSNYNEGIPTGGESQISSDNDSIDYIDDDDIWET